MWNADADGFTCGARIEWLESNDGGGKSLSDAKNQVATEYAVPYRCCSRQRYRSCACASAFQRACDSRPKARPCAYFELQSNNVMHLLIYFGICAIG